MKTDDCEIVGGECYYDGSGLAPTQLFAKFFDSEGHEAHVEERIWTELEDWYRSAEGQEEERNQVVTSEGIA
jgi:hypothetical protein